MNCRQAQDWLLQSEDPQLALAGSADLAAHVAGCAVCRLVAEKVRRLEQAWRALPVPAGAIRARAAFLKQLPRPAVLPIIQPRRTPPRRLRAPRWAVAALVFLAVGMGAWLLFPAPRAHAGPELVDRLVDWNLALTTAASPEERNRLYAERAPQLKEELQKADMPADERALAESLLENGTWLAGNDDPVAEADRFNDVADKLLARMGSATDGGDAGQVNRLARLYSQVADRGISANLEKAEAAAPADPKAEQKLEAAALRHERHVEATAALVQRAPAPAQKEVRHAHEISAKQQHKQHKHKNPKSRGK